MSSAYTDPATLKQQYADRTNLTARADIYAFQHPRVDFPAWVLAHLPDAARAGPLLDVGCGPGWSVARAATSGAPTIGLDLSAGMVAQASASFPDVGGWLVGDAMALPVRSDSCSAAMALHMLYHVPDPAQAVTELSRVVRAGGTVLAVVNGADHMDTYRSLTAEAAGRTEWMPWPGNRVHLGHRALFEPAFPSVEMDELRGRIDLADVAPLMAYAGSAREFYEHQVEMPWSDYESRLHDVAERHLAEHGRIEITTHSGVFVCTVAG